MNPYLILGVSREADDQTIRRAYLDAIKLATPESNPDRFKLLTAAYEKVRDEPRRHRFELGKVDSPGDSPLAVLLNHASSEKRPAPLPLEQMKEYLQVCSKM